MTRPVTITHRAATDNDIYGNTTDATSGTTTTVGYLEQTAATEVIVDRATYTSEHLLFLPSDTTIDANDRTTVDADTFEVIGPPHNVWNPRLQIVSHIECRLRRVV